ncbi:hypothetical protein X925_00135 [Petrotoga sp. 9T1HF07.CasAA.8.2]|nr:hypothetical protein X925_00135 [Petrotoga sp. 9T1HF07.CasAA.8.2]PNR93021.1 hypothetical protein X926_04765 [Petrotoga sp. HWHPT.55.6.3]
MQTIQKKIYRLQYLALKEKKIVFSFLLAG